MAHFWRGPITSKRQASDIIRWTGWLFVSFAIIPIVFSAYAPRFSVYFGFITPILSVLILWKRSTIAAGTLLALMVVLTIGSIVITIWMIWYEFANSVFSRSGEYVLGTAFWALLILLTWRAFRAMRAWPSLNSNAPASNAALDEARPLNPPWIR